MIFEHITIPLYIASLFIIHLVYIAVFLGIFVTIPEYIRILNIITQVFLCIVLMIRFHPFKTNPKIHHGDNMFIFGAVFILFTNVVLTEFTKIPIIQKLVDKSPIRIIKPN
jgi:hypothetical protein